MSGPFAPGDVVVCVDARPRFNRPCELEENRFYRVEKICVGRNGFLDAGMLGLLVEGARSFANQGSFAADRFRHLPKADEAFTEAMRAIKPVRKTVQA